jgi:protein SCO1/2
MQITTDKFRNFAFHYAMVLLLPCLLLLLWGPVANAGIAAEDNPASHGKHQDNGPKLPDLTGPLGVEEHLGEMIPTDLLFLDEYNTPVRLAELIKKPTLILPVYFHCPNACPLLMANLAAALNDVVLQPGKDFQVIAFSFDPDDTPEYALKAKNNYSQILNKSFPHSAWTFLTADPEVIERLTQAIGFHYQQTGKYFFNHASVLLVTSETGKIIRYIYGPNFLPFDISMALSEAAKGTPGVSIKKLLSFCFSYDPASKRYVFNTFKLVAISTLIILALFYFFVLRKGNRRN